MARPKQKINITKLAAEAGVSHMTVSRVLNNRTGVSESVRAKVKALQQKYGYKTNYQASCKPKVALTSSNLDFSDYHQKLFSGIVNYSRESDIEITILPKSPSDPDFINQVRDMQCSGIIVSLASLHERAYEALNNSGLPVMLLDGQCDYPNIGYVDNASYAGSRCLAEHLLENGHRKIGYLLHGMEQTGNHLQRLAGYRDVLGDAGIDFPDTWIQPVNVLMEETGLPYWDNVPSAVARLLEKAPDLTAIMVVDDSLALRCMDALARMGLRIPEDISIAGFDDDTDSAYWYPGLTTVSHNLADSIRIAAEALEYAIQNPGELNLPRTILPTELVIRGTVKALKE